jgi:hypothetical protein
MYMNKVGGYTVTMFEINEDTDNFLEWYKNSQYTSEFAIEVTDDAPDEDGKVRKVLEVLQFNPFFSVDALEEVYLIETKEDHICEECADKKMMN